MANQLRSRYAHNPARSSFFESLEQRLPLTAGPTVVNVEVSGSSWAPAFISYLSGASLGTEGYRIPVGTLAQVKTLPWGNVDKISVTFSEDVLVESRHLALSSVGNANVQIQQFAYDPQSFTAVWTLSAPLVKNQYVLEIDGDGLAPVRNLQGNPLDGEWTTSSSTYPSGNSTAGGDFTFEFRALPGDGNQNGNVDNFDYLIASSKTGLTTSSAGYSPMLDWDGSGSHTSGDASSIHAQLWATYPSGTPVGLTNNAPSSKGGGYFNLSSSAVDLAIDLWDRFSDAETPDDELTYQIVSVSNSALWSSAAINVVTGVLDLTPAVNATGRSVVIVRATDAAGQSVDARYVTDIGARSNVPTVYLNVETDEVDVWRVLGTVTDDMPVEGLVVELSGAFNCSVRVESDGTFEVNLRVTEEGWGDVYAFAFDRDGGQSVLKTKFLGEV